MLIEANGIRLNYEQSGQGPDLVLIPGLGGTVHLWYAQLARLSAVMRVTAVDPRGHGASDRPPGPYSMRLWADDTAALMRAVGLDRAVVVGSSMSAMVAVELAAAYPELARAVVLVGGFPKLAPAGKERMEQRARLVDEGGMEAVADQVVATALGAATHQNQPALAGLFRAGLLRNDPAAYSASVRAIVAADVTPLLEQVECPALVVLGDGEQVAPLPAALALRAGLRQAALRVIPEAGHLPFLEQPQAFNAALLEFVGGL